MMADVSSSSVTAACDAAPGRAFFTRSHDRIRGLTRGRKHAPPAGRQGQLGLGFGFGRQFDALSDHGQQQPRPGTQIEATASFAWQYDAAGAIDGYGRFHGKKLTTIYGVFRA